MLSANLAVLFVLQFFGNKFFILATEIHSPLANRTLQLNKTILAHMLFITQSAIGIAEPKVRIELTTYSLPWSCSTSELLRPT